jgi:hypothetical protein
VYKTQVSITVSDMLVNYEHTAGSTLPILTADGITSSVRLGGLLTGVVATTIDQYSAGNGISTENIAADNFSYSFVYTVSSAGEPVQYTALSLDAYAKDTDRRYQLSYIIEGSDEVFITDGQVATGGLDDEGNFDEYNPGAFTTSSNVEFIVYWQGGPAASSESRVYVDDFMLNGIVGGDTPVVTDLSGAVVASVTHMTLSWTAIAGETYRVMATTNLVDGPWTNMVGPVDGVVGVLSVTNILSERQQFYRIELD